MLAHGSSVRSMPYLRRSHKVAPHKDLSVIINHAAGAGLSPVAVSKAYEMGMLTWKQACKIGIVSLGGTIQPGDISSAFEVWGLPAPVITSITTNGVAPVSDPGGANVENMLDVELSAVGYTVKTGKPAQMIFCSAPNDGTGIADAINALVAAGCGLVSISWGAPESQWSASDRAVTEQALLNAVSNNCTVCVASGDNSEDDGTTTPTCDYPCGSANSWAVGGTALTLAADGSIASEKAWGDGKPGDEGGGGGFDGQTPLPAWQSGIVTGLFRGCPDSSANADPNTGYQIISDGQWSVVGGTSCSAPLTAGFFAAIKSAGAVFGHPGHILYPAAKTCFRDITTGSNGDPAAAGWDPATGLGSPIGPGLAATLLAGAGTTPPGPTPPPVPVPPPAPVPPPTQGTVTKQWNDACQRVEAVLPQDARGLEWIRKQVDRQLAGR